MVWDDERFDCDSFMCLIFKSVFNVKFKEGSKS